MKKNVIKRKALPLALSGLLALMCCASNPAWSANDATSFDPTKVEVKAKGTGGVPVGTIIAWPSASQPEDPENWLECDGRTISATDYPELYAFIGSNVPDYRGLFLRGLGGKSGALGVQQEAGTYVPNTTARITGNLGKSVYIPHATGIRDTGYSFTYAYERVLAPASNTQNFSVTFNTGSDETRPVNKAVRYMIRALP